MKPNDSSFWQYKVYADRLANDSEVVENGNFQYFLIYDHPG